MSRHGFSLVCPSSHFSSVSPTTGLFDESNVWLLESLPLFFFFFKVFSILSIGLGFMTLRRSISALQTEAARHPESLPIDLTDQTMRKQSEIFTQAGGKGKKQVRRKSVKM